MPSYDSTQIDLIFKVPAGIRVFWSRPIAVKGYHDRSNSYIKKKMSSGLAYSLRGLIYHPCGRKHGIILAFMVLEK